MTANPDTSLTIDTHHHILPDFFWQETENAHAPVGGLAPLRWSKEATTSFMDDAGIDVAVVSLSTPGVHTGDSAKARALARRCNEFSAELVHARPDRFGGFACLPLPDVDASLEELSYALDVLGLDGFVLFTNSNGVYLGDPALEPVFEELERRKTVVYEARLRRHDGVYRWFLIRVEPFRDGVVYAYMQAVGMVNDHLVDCFRYREIRRIRI
jgi:predicted TIM-barrel fold metal-dependent hydrolase